MTACASCGVLCVVGSGRGVSPLSLEPLAVVCRPGRLPPLASGACRRGVLGVIMGRLRLAAVSAAVRAMRRGGFGLVVVARVSPTFSNEDAPALVGLGGVVLRCVAAGGRFVLRLSPPPISLCANA